MTDDPLSVRLCALILAHLYNSEDGLTGAQIVDRCAPSSSTRVFINLGYMCHEKMVTIDGGYDASKPIRDQRFRFGIEDLT